MRLARTLWKDLVTGLAEAGQGLLAGAPNGRRTRTFKTSAAPCCAPRARASAVTLARRALDAFARLDSDERDGFFEFLRRDLDPEPAALDAAIERYRASPGSETAAALTAAAEPPRQELLRLMNTAPDGTRDILAMREALLDALSRHPALKAVDDDFVHLLRSWFNRGFLELHRIDWRTPAPSCSKRSSNTSGAPDPGLGGPPPPPAGRPALLRFFHPSLPDEPLIFVEVALCSGLTGSVTDLLFGAVEPDVEADTAIFYSISNCQRGLTGISFGNFLIKQVVRELSAEVPGLRTFATLSPVPGFRRSVVRAAREGRLPAAPDGGGSGGEDLSGVEAPEWPADSVPGSGSSPPDALCAHYLCTRSAASTPRSGRPLSPAERRPA